MQAVGKMKQYIDDQTDVYNNTIAGGKMAPHDVDHPVGNGMARGSRREGQTE